MPGYDVQPDSPESPDVRRLLETHLVFAAEHSPPEHVHALDVPQLIEDHVSFYSIRVDGELLGVGAIQELDTTHGELKSIHTVESARGRGIGRAMVAHLIAVARTRGYSRVSLETGSMEAFRPSRILYERMGFEVCPPFGKYWDNEYSTCMTLQL